MGSEKVDVKPLITDTYPFEESIAAFEAGGREELAAAEKARRVGKLTEASRKRVARMLEGKDD